MEENALIRIGVFGKDYTFSYNVANLTEGIIEKAEKTKERLEWFVPNFPTKVHDHAVGWLTYKGQDVKRLDIEKMMKTVDFGLVFWDNQSDGVLEAARRLTQDGRVCYIIDDKPKIEATVWE